MTVAYVSLTFKGGVSLVRQTKQLSKKEVELRIEDATKNPPSQWTNKVFTDCPSYTNDVELNEQDVVQKLNISAEQMRAILNGSAKPSDTLLRANGLKVKTKEGWVFNSKKWNAMSDYAKLMMFYEDHRIDLGATSHSIHFITQD